MSLVRVQDLVLSFGDRVLFDHESFQIGPTDRIGLVGANGTGKSSLLKILAGQLVPDSGGISFRRRARAGYLAQDIAALPEGPLVDAVLSTVPGRDELHTRRVETEAALAEAREEAEQLELAQILADLHEELAHFEERYGRHRAERILSGLGFTARDFARATHTLSGGWRMRAALAGLLLQDPDLLLLDEPTNHLDLPTLTWFDAFLERSKKALVLISHDRHFLNRHIDRVLSLEMEGLRSYTGDYEDYRRQRAEEVEQLEARAERQAARRAEIQAFIDRFRAKNTKASQVQSRIKALEREEIVEKLKARATVHFDFPEVAHSGREVLQLRGVRKSFGPHLVYDGVDAAVLRGQRVAIVGVNGAGKTTLLKLIAGELEPDDGEIVFGHNVGVGYYAQHHAEALDAGSTVLDEIAALVPEKPQSFVRGVLGAFLFSGDDVEKHIGVLSGGERARVALAKLLMKPANFLLMDEPTNHLDLDSSEALIGALKRYGGTLVFVSHNQSFLDQLATDVWDVRDRKVLPFPGNLSDYLYHLRQQTLGDGAETAARSEPKKRDERDRRRAEAEERQLRYAVEGPIKKEIAELETQIAALEAAQKEREAQLADGSLYDDFARARAVFDAHRDAKAQLESLYARWEDAQRRLEAAGGDAGESGGD